MCPTSRSCKESERENDGEFVRSEYTKPWCPFCGRVCAFGWPLASGKHTCSAHTSISCAPGWGQWTDGCVQLRPPPPCLSGSCLFLAVLISAACVLCFFCLCCQVLSQIFPGLYSFVASFVVSCLLLSCVSAYAGKTWPVMAVSSLFFNLLPYFHWI